jgi:hypothetical protein
MREVGRLRPDRRAVVAVCIDACLRLREEPPYFTDDDIRRAREELRR